MPPKRKAAAAKKAPGPAAKKPKGRGKAKKPVPEEVEESEEEEASDIKKAIEALKGADKGKKKSHKVDALCPRLLASSAEVYEDYDCMLNQTNIGGNNNKYYIIQVLKTGPRCFYAWNRWGRVGESGMNALKGPFTEPGGAIKDFEKKFRDKTKNAWAQRENFTTYTGKYTMIDMGGDEEEEDDSKVAQQLAKLDEIDGVKKVVAPCTLDKETQVLMKLIFDTDMFKEAMATMEIDVKKMPLGKLSKAQIGRGFEALDSIEAALKNKSSKKVLEELSSKFYTAIPHDFGRQRPPTLSDDEQLRKKFDMLMVLADIELAQALQKDKMKQNSLQSDVQELPHPLDQNYEMLKCELQLLDSKSKEFKVIETYTKNTTGGWRKPTIEQVWRINRAGEAGRFAAHDAVGARKLLWHGTNVAVVAAILKSGLRIMPHSGGRVGKGIYSASENSKSAAYVRCAGNTGIMFLNEIALGKEHHITMDDWRLTQPPKGYDSIVAKGHTEPDPSKDTHLMLDGHKVVVPQGKPMRVAEFSGSSFSQSEYLVYKESQARMRYLLKMKF